ncbi:MAG TPA: NHL repeat-containing protein, partial [Candidatus Acidoferrales bacterium]|nr:NHL repeat-containing protein [Candidatus Acidoferrales bacterium]
MNVKCLAAILCVWAMAGCGGTTGAVGGNSGMLPGPAPAARAAKTATITCVVGTLDASYPNACTGSPFNSPFDVAVDAKRNVYVADTGNNAIEMITPQGKLTCIAATTGSDGICSNSVFNGPGGVAVDARGNVYVADSGSARILEVLAPLRAPWKVKQLGSSFAFVLPQKIAVDTKGDVYVVDTNTNGAYEIAAHGAVACIAGAGSGCPKSHLTAPAAVAVDGAGNVYIPDAGSGEIFRLTTKHKVIVLATGFASPGGIAVDSKCKTACRVYVADTNHNEIDAVTGKTGLPIVGPQFCGAGTCDFQGPRGVAVQF